MLPFALVSLAVGTLQVSASVLDAPVRIAKQLIDVFKPDASGSQWAIRVPNDKHDSPFEHPSSYPPTRPPSKTEKTIYDFLNSTSEFSTLAKIVNLNNETIELLSDNTTGITFFAPPNWALKPPRGHRPHMDESYDGIPAVAWHEKTDPAEVSLLRLVEAVESFELGTLSTIEGDDDDNDEKKKKFRKIIRIIARAVIAYHVIPKPLAAPELAVNRTYATNLTIGYGFLDGEPSRVRVEANIVPHGSFSVNFFSRTVGPELVAANGILYKVARPVLPPPAIFQELFIATSVFSTATSAFQRVGLTSELERVYKHDAEGEHGTLEGSGTATIFVPSNHAFNRLPTRLRLFLFSPLGHRVLETLLRYHVVPSVVVHTDYFHNATKSASTAEAVEDWVPTTERASLITEYPEYEFSNTLTSTLRSTSVYSGSGLRAFPETAAAFMTSKDSCRKRHNRPPISVPVYGRNFTLPTLLEGHSLNVTVAKERFPAAPGLPAVYVSWLSVDGHVALLADAVSATGAIHVIDHVLNPNKGRVPPGAPPRRDDDQREGFQSEEDSWSGWEDWLVRWAHKE